MLHRQATCWNGKAEASLPNYSTAATHSAASNVELAIKLGEQHVVQLVSGPQNCWAASCTMQLLWQVLPVLLSGICQRIVFVARLAGLAHRHLPACMSSKSHIQVLEKATALLMCLAIDQLCSLSTISIQSSACTHPACMFS